MTAVSAERRLCLRRPVPQHRPRDSNGNGKELRIVMNNSAFSTEFRIAS